MPVVGAGIAQLEAAAAGVRPLAPCGAVVVRHFVNGNAQWLDRNGSAVAEHLLWLGQQQPLAAIRKSADVVADHELGVEALVFGQELFTIFCDDDVSAGRQRGRVGENERDAVVELPVAEVDRFVAVIVQLDILVVVVERDRVVHDLVDDNRVLERCGVRLAKRWLRKMIPLRAAVRGAAKRVAVRLRSVMQRVEHAVALGVEQPDRAPIGRELEAKRGFRHRKGFAPGQLRALGEGVFFLADRVG